MTYTREIDIDRTTAHPLRRMTLLVSRSVSFVVYLYLMVVEVILALGFFLLLLGANPSSSFVDWVYRSMDRSMRPFRGIFEPVQLGVSGNDVASIFETSVVFAMIVYAIVALAFHAVLTWLNSRLDRLDREDRRYQAEQLALRTASARSAATRPATTTTPPPPPPAGPA